MKKDWKEIAWLWENSLSISVDLLWLLFGKVLGNYSLRDNYRLMQAKSYLRTSIPRAIHKLQKASNCAMVLYYQAKFNIAMIKYQKSASDAIFQKVFGLLKEFKLPEGVGNEYQVKVFYLQAELAFMTKNYQ